MLILLSLVFSRARCSRARAFADCDYGVGVRVGRRRRPSYGVIMIGGSAIDPP